MCEKEIVMFDVVWHRTEEGTKKIYERNRYEVLILWQDELSNEADVVSKVRQFNNELSLPELTGESK